jgi:DNA-binding response OmpR family regulator
MILIVEPLAELRLARRQCLQSLGFAVIEAESYDEVFSSAYSTLPFLIVVSSRAGDYLDFCRELKTAPVGAASPYLLLITDKISDEQMNDSLDGILIEPIADVELVAWVNIFRRLETLRPRDNLNLPAQLAAATPCPDPLQTGDEHEQRLGLAMRAANLAAWETLIPSGRNRWDKEMAALLRLTLNQAE